LGMKAKARRRPRGAVQIPGPSSPETMMAKIYDLLAKTGVTSLETKIAAFLGRFWRDRVLKNRPLEGVVGDVFLTRGKIRGQSRNIIEKGYVSPEHLRELYAKTGLYELEYPEIYEVVYQAWLLADSGKKYLLSLFKHQLWMLNSRVRITKYNCIVHLGHRFVIGSDVEIYPVEVELIGT